MPMELKVRISPFLKDSKKCKINWRSWSKKRNWRKKNRWSNFGKRRPENSLILSKKWWSWYMWRRSRLDMESLWSHRSILRNAKKMWYRSENQWISAKITMIPSLPLNLFAFNHKTSYPPNASSDNKFTKWRKKKTTSHSSISFAPKSSALFPRIKSLVLFEKMAWN